MYLYLTLIDSSPETSWAPGDVATNHRPRRAEILRTAPKRHAILSHRWRRHEQTFKNLQAIARQCAGTRTDPRTLLSNKIRKAAQHGFEPIWIDTWSIDKMSSAELSEAGNSIFSWYCLSTICYADLSDVPVVENPFAVAAAFRRSSWFTRGWTLQEDVIFLSREWVPLLSKRSHPDFSQEIRAWTRTCCVGSARSAT